MCGRYYIAEEDSAAELQEIIEQLNRRGAEVDGALFKKFCKRDFCDEVRDFKIPEPEAVAS